ncbi:MAG: mRNA surveillance protein pelota [archaeon]
MRILKKDLKHGTVSLSPEQQDDLWYLSQLIEVDDIVVGKAERKVKLGEAEEKTRVTRKTFTARIAVERVEYEPTLGSLRIGGVMQEGTDDAPSGSHQSLLVEPADRITVIKPEWLSFHLERLEESQKGAPGILILVHDREEAYLAKTERSGYRVLAHLSGNVAKKDDDRSEKGDFYGELARSLADYDARLNPDVVIVASPAFFSESVIALIKDAVLKKKVVKATCGSVTKNAIDEVLTRDETKAALADDRTAKEAKSVEELLARIGKDEAVAYGKAATIAAAAMGAVDLLLVTDAFIQKQREGGTGQDVEDAMRTIDRSKGRILIVSSASDAGKKLDGLGGMAGLLRYKVS